MNTIPNLTRVAAAVARLERKRWNPGLHSDETPSYRYRVAKRSAGDEPVPHDANLRHYPHTVGDGCRAGFYHRDFLH